MNQSELELITIWKDILEGSEYPWVLFQFGTCVIVREFKNSLVDTAKELLKKWGNPIPGTPSNKFSISYLTSQGIPGCLVGCHHPDILTYVAPAEAVVSNELDYVSVAAAVGKHGRNKRKWDSENSVVLYQRDPRIDNI